MAKIEQLIQLKDNSGVLKNLSELLQEARDKNITSLVLGFTRKDDSSRVFWSGEDIADINLLLDIMKNDIVSNRFNSETLVNYGEE